MIWKEKEWVFHFTAKNKKTGEVREFNLGSQVCKVPHRTKKFNQLQGLNRKWKESGSDWTIVCYGVQPLETYSYDSV